MDWFLYDNDSRHERVNALWPRGILNISYQIALKKLTLNIKFHGKF